MGNKIKAKHYKVKIIKKSSNPFLRQALIPATFHETNFIIYHHLTFL